MGHEPMPSATDAAFEPRGGASDPLDFLRRHRRGFVVATAACALLTAAGAAVAMLLPPTARIASIDIVPTFPGAKNRLYPNGSSFSPNDIVAQSVVEPVWRARGLEGTVSVADLCRSLTVEDGGTQVELLRSDYMQRLGNARLTAAERSAIEAEFSSKLKAIAGSTLTISLNGTGARLADAQMSQLLLAIPAEWARSSDAAGARSYDFPLPMGRELRESAKRLIDGSSAALAVLHTERMKDFIDALAVSIKGMSKLAGSDQVRDARGASLVDLSQDVTAARRNLVTPAYVDALARAQAADPVGYEALRSTRLKLLETELEIAKERGRVLREAFASYSDQTRGVMATGSRLPEDSRITGMTANVDGTFIDRVIEQAVNSRDVEYRRKFMERQIEAELVVTAEQARLEFERWLDDMADKRAAMPSQSAPAQLPEVTEMIAGFADRAQEIMRTLTARNLNSASTMYRVDLPPGIRITPALPVRAVALAGFALWAVSLAVVAVFGALDDRRRTLRYGQIDPDLLADAREDLAGSVAARLADRRDGPRRLPDERRQPVA